VERYWSFEVCGWVEWPGTPAGVPDQRSADATVAADATGTAPQEAPVTA
jgi:hypothetical protein